MTNDQPFIDVRHAQKSFGTLEVLKDINLQVKKGQIVAIIGPSGSGKSTLLRAINDLDPLTGGEIWLEDMQVNKDLPHRQYEKHINKVRQDIGMVFQHFNLFPHLTVRENIALAPKMLKDYSDDEANELVEEQLAKVGLSDRIDYYPAQLSGGQKQRVAIARALAMKPKVMLFDEATSALDPEHCSWMKVSWSRKGHLRSFSRTLKTNVQKYFSANTWTVNSAESYGRRA
jgi:polar amino acid transport system ATP-binding protein